MGKKASENFKVYQNENGPKISTVSRSVIEEDGKYFKDIDGSGKVSEVNDWRLPARKRAVRSWTSPVRWMRLSSTERRSLENSIFRGHPH